MNVQANILNSESRSRWALPLFLTHKNKYPYAALFGFIAAALYLLSNHYHLSEPKLLNMTEWDSIIPFIPQTVWIYVSEYLLFVAAYALAEDLKNANQYLYSFMGLQIMSIIIFIFWPTTYPRDLFPLPKDLDILTYTLFNSLRTTDTPANCCPSLHVSSCYLSSFLFLGERYWKKFIFFFIWATIIGITTLTTKQHYIVDVLTGFLMAALAYWIFHKYVPYRSLHQASR